MAKNCSYPSLNPDRHICSTVASMTTCSGRQNYFCIFRHSGCDFFGPIANLPIHGRTFANKFFRLRLMYFLFVRCGYLARVRVFERRTHGHTYIDSRHVHFGSSSLFCHLPPFFWCSLMTSIIVMPTTEIFVVNSAGVGKRVSKLLARFYRYKKQIAAGNMDPIPRVSVDATHPAVTAARRRSGKTATERQTPPARTSPPRLAKASNNLVGDLAPGDLFVCEFCICSTNKVPGGSLYVSTYKIYEHTNRKWSFCNVYMCVRLKKSPFLATNTHKTVKQGLAKEKKFNTVLCVSVNQLSGQRNHSLITINSSQE